MRNPLLAQFMSVAAMLAFLSLSLSLSFNQAQAQPAPAKGPAASKAPPAPAKPAPRTADGHPDFNGYWKNMPGTRPVGNIGKDLPEFKLPLTPAGEAALRHNLTATIDRESLCII